MTKEQPTKEQKRALREGEAVILDGAVVTNPKKSNKFRSTEADVFIDDKGVLRI